MKNDYEVGYGKPPKATRFVRGKSGNPYGRPPSCLPKAQPAKFVDILMKELDAPITMMEGGRSKKISKQMALIKNLVKCAIDGNSGAIAKLFKLVRQHGLLLDDDRDVINILEERYDFIFKKLDVSRMSESEMEEKDRSIQEFLKHPVSYLTGKLRLAPDHPLNLKPRLKMRPSTAIADDLLFELRETITFKAAGKKFTVTKLEALVKSLLNQAILGNDKAFLLLLRFFKHYGWDKEDGSVIKVSGDSPLGQFIGLGTRRRARSRRSGRSDRLLGRSSRDGKGGDDARQSADN